MFKSLLMLAMLTLGLWGQSPPIQEGIELLPSRIEVIPGEATQFGLRLRFSGFTAPAVLASCSGGSIDAQGRYLAPLEPGAYQVKVWIQNREDLCSTATVFVLPRKLPVIERFEYVAPLQEISWRVEGAVEVRVDPGLENAPHEGHLAAPEHTQWVTLWASNETGSVTRILAIPEQATTTQAAPAQASEATVIEAQPAAPPARKTLRPLGRWTLQLSVLANEKNVESLRASGVLDLPGVITFKVRLGDGRMADCICYGQYANRAAAQEAIRSLPAELRTLGDQPFVRRVSTGI